MAKNIRRTSVTPDLSVSAVRDTPAAPVPSEPTSPSYADVAQAAHDPAAPTSVHTHTDTPSVRSAPDTRIAPATPIASLPPLTPKQREFIRQRVQEGKSLTEAYIGAYEHNGLRKTAQEEASRTARLPQVKLQMEKYSAKAEDTVLEVMNISKGYARSGNNAGAAYASTALQAANSILDRVHGKATQRVETQATAVNINIDLTGVS